MLDFLIPTELLMDFSSTIYNFRFDNNAKSALIQASETEYLNTVFTINFPNKESNLVESGGRSYVQFSVEINSLGGDNVNFGNDTIFSIGKVYKDPETEYIEVSPTIDGSGRYPARVISEYTKDNGLKNGYGWAQVTLTELPISAESSIHASVNVTYPTGATVVTVILDLYDKIDRLVTRDDFQGLSTRTFQTKSEIRALTTDSGSSWGSSSAVIANINNFFHRSILDQIAGRSKYMWQLKIEIPTFEPYYRRVVLESVGQASPLGGLLALSCTYKEV